MTAHPDRDVIPAMATASKRVGITAYNLPSMYSARVYSLRKIQGAEFNVK